MHRLGLILWTISVSVVPAVAGDLTGTVEVAGKRVKHAVIWLDAKAPDAPAPAARVVLDQRNISFVPQVLVVRVGTAVDFPNSDTVFHNVFSFRDGKKFDLGMYPTGTSKRIVFDKPGLARLFCNIHPNMAAYVMAVDTPYYAMSDDRGAFTIAGVPPGTYTYHAWSAGETPLSGTVVVDGAHPLAIKW